MNPLTNFWNGLIGTSTQTTTQTSSSNGGSGSGTKAPSNGSNTTFYIIGTLLFLMVIGGVIYGINQSKSKKD